MVYEAYLRREAAELDSYYRQERRMYAREIAAARDEARKIARRAEQSRAEGQLDLFRED
jgi:hypothetical protein